MYTIDPSLGLNVIGNNLGDAWLSLVEAVLKHGETSHDEGRKRLALQNIRLKALNQSVSDALLAKYADSEGIEKMKELFFHEPKMRDFDVLPSFGPGAKSYYQRIIEGKMIEFVVKRLSAIPESKKAVMVFPTYRDYEEILKNQRNDYMPCLVSFQIRLLEEEDCFVQNSIFFMRSWDAFQKAPGNLVTMTMLAQKIAEELQGKLRKGVKVGFLDGMVTDAHIYEESIEDAKRTIEMARASKELPTHPFAYSL